MKTHYDVLGVPPRADDEAIRVAYRRAAKVYHPDLNVGDSAAEQRVKQIIAAYEVLGNPKRRAAYDLRLSVRRQQNVRRFFATALASAGVFSSIALTLVAWHSKRAVAPAPVLELSVSSAPERAASKVAIEINNVPIHGIAFANSEAPQPHEAPASEWPSSVSQPVPAAEDADIPTDQAVAQAGHRPSEDVADVGSNQRHALTKEWRQLAQGGDPTAIVAFAGRNPETPESVFARSWLDLLIEGTDEASLLQALVAASDAMVAERALQRLRHLASSAVARTDGTTAIATKDPDSAAASNDPQFYLARGLVRSGKADFDGAIADFDAAIAIGPPSATAFGHRANAWGGKGNLDHALADFERAIRIDPTSAAIFRDRGILWRRNGAPDRALVDFDQAIRLGFSDAAAYNERGQVWLERGHFGRAIADFNQAIKIDPDFAGAYANRAIALRSKGEVERAVADLDQAKRLDPGVSSPGREAGTGRK